MQKGISRAGGSNFRDLFHLVSLRVLLSSASTYCFHPRFPIHRRFKGGAARIYSVRVTDAPHIVTKTFVENYVRPYFFSLRIDIAEIGMRDGNPGRFVKKECKKIGTQ